MLSRVEDLHLVDREELEDAVEGPETGEDDLLPPGAPEDPVAWLALERAQQLDLLDALGRGRVLHLEEGNVGAVLQGAAGGGKGGWVENS